MNKPDTQTQKAVINRAIYAVEEANFSLDISSEAMQSIGVPTSEKDKLEKLHVFYTAKLNALIE